MNKCMICNLNNAVYKCPKCRLKYCSINCYKNHQETDCESLKTEETCSESTYKYITRDTIPEDKLKLLDDSKQLKTILNNPHVRDILLEIDSSENVSEIMDQAMKEPIFVEFADACLNLVQNK